MREITTHKGNELDDALRIESHQTGADRMLYLLTIPGRTGFEEAFTYYIKFQNGPVKECGINGISIESLLAICIDRLEGFQSGPYRNSSNEEANAHLKCALGALKARSRDRQARGVEGTSQA